MGFPIERIAIRGGTTLVHTAIMDPGSMAGVVAGNPEEHLEAKQSIDVPFSRTGGEELRMYHMVSVMLAYPRWTP
jgi:hypothetical protein